MQLRVNVLLIAALLACAAIAQAVTYTGTVSVDSVQAQPGTSCAVAIRLANSNVGLSALTVPLSYDHPSLKLDSVSFVGSIIPSNFTPVVYNDSINKTVQVSYIPFFENPIPVMNATGGVLARLFFKVAASASSATIQIDTIFKDEVIVVPQGDHTDTIHIYTRIQVSDYTGLATGYFYPGFTAGAVIVKVPTDVNDTKAALPVAFELGQNYPNPFNPTTTISFSLPAAGQVKLEVFNVLGQLVSTALNREMEAGTHQVEFNARALPSGIYFYRLSSPFGVETRKMVLLK